MGRNTTIAVVHFYYFHVFICSVPTKGDDRQQWIKAIETNQEFDHQAQRFAVCELHFTAESINRQWKKTI